MGQYNSTTSWELALKPRLTYCKSSFKLPPLNSAPPPPLFRVRKVISAPLPRAPLIILH